MFVFEQLYYTFFYYSLHHIVAQKCIGIEYSYKQSGFAEDRYIILDKKIGRNELIANFIKNPQCLDLGTNSLRAKILSSYRVHYEFTTIRYELEYILVAIYLTKTNSMSCIKKGLLLDKFITMEGMCYFNFFGDLIITLVNLEGMLQNSLCTDEIQTFIYFMPQLTQLEEQQQRSFLQVSQRKYLAGNLNAKMIQLEDFLEQYVDFLNSVESFFIVFIDCLFVGS
eukprot:TRINITY_DN3381_c0_g2_i2.p2 TRINITY_DN3381_c0_g2~~TRINITY_DN3381_c0_g2_i2.p2  ORF type:complete len:225 (-),score=1.76 TRINITY_DN3381_c0_g2_i2:219-893(-)